MALLGSSVDPRLFMQDYSGFTRAAEIQAQGMQNLGAAIGQGIKDYGEIVGERKKTDAQIKADDVSIESAIKLGKSLGIDINSYLEPIQALRKDPNTTPAESLALGRAAAQGISNAFTLGIGAQEREIAAQRAKAEAGYKQGMLGAAQTRAAASLFSAKQAAGELKETEISIFDPEIKKERKEKVLIDKRGQYYERDTKRPIIDTEKFFYGEEGGLGELPPTSQVGGSASDLIASAAEMNIGKLSTAKTPGTQGGNVGCADAICRTFKQATGEELVPGGTLSTREMATTLENDQRFVKVPLGQAQKGDIVLTPRKGNKAGHTGIVLDGGAIASNSSKGFAGKAPGTFVQNYTIDSWKRSVAPRNPSETAAYRYVGSQGIDNALAMGGDMTQQAMGTPQQQAEAARQIEQGQQLNLSTAQNIPQGAIPTEPSMITQQPQLPQPQRRMVRGIPVGGSESTKKIEIVTGPTAQELNLDPRGTYEVSREDGNIIGVQTIKAAPTISETLALEKREEEKVAKQQAAESVKAKSERMVTLMTELRNHPGFGGLFGVGYTGVPGTESANAKVLYDQIQAQGFMEAIKDMKGMGALSNAEGEKASAAFVGINPSMSEDAALKRIDEVIKYIQTGEERLKTGKLIETKANQGPSIGGANSYFNQYTQPPAR